MTGNPRFLDPPALSISDLGKNSYSFEFTIFVKFFIKKILSRQLGPVNGVMSNLITVVVENT